MSRRDKLIKKIRARPTDAKYRDVRALLEDFGWSVDRTRGSHVTYVKSGELSITIPKDGGKTVSRVYLDMICERLRLDD